MEQQEQYDYVLLGSGAGAKLLAWNLSSAQPGKKVAIIERQWIGGSCPNVACLPSKNFVNTADVIHTSRQVDGYGLVTNNELNLNPGRDAKVDMAVVRQRKAAMVQDEVDFHVNKFAETGVELIRGLGRFVGPKTLQVDNRMLAADVVIIGVGSHSVIDASIPGLKEANPLTHVELLDIDEVPSHLVILGGGYVGVEFAQIFRRLGSSVTIIERSGQILQVEDEDVVSELAEVLQKEGIDILTSTTVRSVSGTSGDGVEVVTSAAKHPITRGTHLLVAAGRAPNTQGIGLDKAGIQTTSRGHIVVDDQLQTSVPGVFAVGDCTGGPHFTHISADDFRVVYAALTASPRPGGTANRQVPSTLFTSPEIAHVGLREKEAKAKNIHYRLAKLPMSGFLRTHTHGHTEGFAKVLLEADGDGILGFTAVGNGVGELLPVVQLAMKLRASYREIENLIIAHPTMNEGLSALMAGVPPRD